MAQRLCPVDKLLLAYLVGTGILALYLGEFTLVAIHAALAVFVIRVVGKLPQFTRVLYPALVVPLLYMELDKLSAVAGGRLYDPEILRLEQYLFGEPTPAIWLSQKLPWYWLSEYLHLCYLSYYPLLFLVALRLYRVAGPSVTSLYLWALQAGTFCAYTIQMFLPVEGPRPLFPPLDESLRGPFWELCHYLCGEGAAGAAAFPSGHVTFAMIVLLFTWKYDRDGFDIYSPFCLGLSLCTVYGRFHYAVDALAGTLIAIIFVLSGPTLFRALEAVGPNGRADRDAASG